jgi:hypothetical protein
MKRNSIDCPKNELVKISAPKQSLEKILQYASSVRTVRTKELKGKLFLN